VGAKALIRAFKALADEVMVIDVAAKLADDTFCPSGYPNPVSSP
jgi:hypothetical protein